MVSEPASCLENQSTKTRNLNDTTFHFETLLIVLLDGRTIDRLPFFSSPEKNTPRNASTNADKL